MGALQFEPFERDRQSMSRSGERASVHPARTVDQHQPFGRGRDHEILAHSSRVRIGMPRRQDRMAPASALIKSARSHSSLYRIDIDISRYFFVVCVKEFSHRLCTVLLEYSPGSV